MFKGKEGADSKTIFLYVNKNKIVQATTSFEIATG